MRQWAFVLPHGRVEKVERELVKLKMGSIPTIFPATEINSHTSREYYFILNCFIVK